MPHKNPNRPLSIPEQIARSVSESVFQGRYQPGEAISEQSLAEYFQVSRGPVREALRILERDGVVTIVPRRGAKITQLTIGEVVEVYEIRAVLLGLAARMFAERRSDDELAKLEGLLKSLQALVTSGADSDTHSDASAAMAQVIIDGCRNSRLRELLSQLAFQIGRYTRLGLSSAERREASLTSWQELVDAARTRDGFGAQATAQHMVTQTRDHAIRVLKNEGSSVLSRD